jgi:hypothetical protein
MPTYATLELGEPIDALAWQKGCESLGFTSAASIMNQFPALTELEAFFRTQPEWVYFSGHISGTLLYAHQPGTTELQFKKDRVAIKDRVAFATNAISVKYDENARNLQKQTSEFTMHKRCLLVILGGCSALGSLSTMKVIRELFFNPTILGYAEQCDVTKNTAMMGGGSNPSHFFANIRSGADLVNAWLQSGLSNYPSKQSMFRAFDPDGQEWKLDASKVVKGTRV